MVAQRITIGNNLLYDATLTPNLRLGFSNWDHWSVGLTGGYRPWPTDDSKSRKWKHLLGASDVRYWTDSVNVHHFFGANLTYSHYNVADVKFPFGLWKSVRDERRQGDLYAMGLFYGYSWPLGRHWNIEAMIGAAVGYADYERFACGHCGTKLADGHKAFVMPQAGLSVVYNIPGRPRAVAPVEPAEPVGQPVVEPVEPKSEEPVVEVAEPQFSPVATIVPVIPSHIFQLQKENPVLRLKSDYRPYDRSRVLRKEDGVMSVYFPVGRSQISTAYRNNGATLGRIVDITRQIIADTASSVQKIQIIGLSSIEGKPAVNERLAEARAKALQNYIRQRVSVPDSVFETVGGGEAWAEFRDHLQDIVSGQGDVHGLQAAIDIIDGESDVNRREQRLQRLNGGRTWAYLRQHVLSDQRSSGYVRVFFDYVPDANAEAINRAVSLIADGNYEDALNILNNVREDERAQNALGVALWNTGHQQEAIGCFRRAAAAGNSDARENLRHLENPEQETEQAK